MDFNAFEFIQNGLNAELSVQGFGEPQEIDYEEGRAVMFATEEVAYALRYSDAGKSFELCSTTLTDEGAPDTWRSLSKWLYESGSNDRSDAESILNDFTDVIKGPKRVAYVQQKHAKKSKTDERNVDPMFFINRLVNLFPEMKDELNEEKIVYGQVRYATFIRAKAAPRCNELITKYPDSDVVKKLCALLDDMYKNGDFNLRSIVSYTLCNSLDDTAFGLLYDRVGDELMKDLKYSRKLKDKKIKPEKKKKAEKKVEARLQA